MAYQKGFKYVAIIMTLVLVGLYGRMMLTETPISMTFLDAYETFDSYDKVDGNDKLYMLSKDSELVGYLAITSEDGFQSEVFVATEVNTYGLIESVRVVQQNETPSYFRRIEGSSFFKNFSEMAISEGFDASDNVDAVSKATISSVAITKAVQKGAEIIGREGLDIPVNKPSPEFKLKAVDIAILIIFALALAANLTGNKKLRLITMIYAVIILGFRYATFVTYATFYQIITLTFPSVADNLRWYLLVLGSIVTVLVMGKNIYCAYICPFGAIQELEHKFLKVKFDISPKTVKRLKLLPYVISYVALAMALLTETTGVLSYEPFSILFSSVGNEITWGIIFITLFLSLITIRPYCKFICPVGFVFNHIAKVKRIGGKLWKRA